MPFPTNPTNGQQATVNGVIYTYSNTIPAWTVGTNVGSNISANNITATATITGVTLNSSGNISAAGTITGGNILPSANNVFSLGSPTAVWASVYVSANTLYLGNTSLSANANTLTVGGNTVVTTTSSGNVAVTGFVSATGNVTGSYILGNGSQLTGVASGNTSIAITVTTISANATIASGQNGFSVGPVVTANNVQVSIADGQRWVII
jgi:hypothetical protein